MIVNLDELERRKDILQARVEKICKMIWDKDKSCSKSANENSCSDLISEKNAIMLEISKINDVIKKEVRRRKAAGEIS